MTQRSTVFIIRQTLSKRQWVTMRGKKSAGTAKIQSSEDDLKPPARTTRRSANAMSIGKGPATSSSSIRKEADGNLMISETPPMPSVKPSLASRFTKTEKKKINHGKEEPTSTDDDALSKVNLDVSTNAVKKSPKRNKITIEYDTDVKREKWEPQNWAETLANIREMRKNGDAPVDSMGCDKCMDEVAPPEVKYICA